MKSTQRTILLFANPTSGRGLALRLARDLAERLAMRGHVPIINTRHPSQLQLPEHTSSVVIVGGDGTVRAVVERLIALQANPPPVMVVSMGTANLISEHLKITDLRDHADRIVRAIEHPHIVYLDCATANGRLFLLMASAGFDASVVHELEAIRSGPIHWSDYLLPTFSSLIRSRFSPITATIDGRELCHNLPAIAIIGNMDVYGTGFPMVLHARPDDRQLDLLILPCQSRGDLAQIALNVAVGEHLQQEGTIYARGRTMRIESTHPIPVQIDGDGFGACPLDIRLLDVRMPFIVPST